MDGVRDDEWMFAPERMGGVSLQPLVAMCYSGAYTKQDIMDLIRGKGGLMAHLGTANAQEVDSADRTVILSRPRRLPARQSLPTSHSGYP